MAHKLKQRPRQLKMATPNRRRTDLDAGGPSAVSTLLILDDDEVRLRLSSLLTRLGFAVQPDEEGAQSAELFVVDDARRRPVTDGYAIAVIRDSDINAKIEALRAGFDDVLVSSMTDEEIVPKLAIARRMLLRQRHLDATMRELYGLATRDELTGVFNRRYFFAEGERLLGAGVAVNLVLFDLDGFKQVNDTFGHPAGDRILRDVGALFLSRTRHEDVVARYGGDEFVMLVADESIAAVEALTARLADEVAAREWVFDDRRVHVGASTGIASSELLDHPTLAQLLEAGDRDLYKNKWARSHPTADPSLYEYPRSRSNEISELLDFPASRRANE